MVVTDLLWGRGMSVLPGIEWRHQTTGQASALALWVGVDAV